MVGGLLGGGIASGSPLWSHVLRMRGRVHKTTEGGFRGLMRSGSVIDLRGGFKGFHVVSGQRLKICL